MTGGWLPAVIAERPHRATNPTTVFMNRLLIGLQNPTSTIESPNTVVEASGSLRRIDFGITHRLCIMKRTMHTRIKSLETQAGRYWR
jgi:hypothetical protein